jgi:agmatine deiminase
MMKKKTKRGSEPGDSAEEFAAPGAQGYAMPAEWEPHDGTWIAWPHNHAEWPGKFEPIPWMYAELVRVLAEGERVHIFVEPSKGGRLAREVTAILAKSDVNMGHVTLHSQATDRVWTRDSGPIFVRRNSEVGLVDFKFNAWAKYDNSALDDALPAAVAGIVDVPRFVAFGKNDAGEYQRFVLEGGSIDVNGAGSVLTTEECLLSEIQQRNPGFSLKGIEQTLADYLGISQVLWLDRGIAGDDDTHGHIDDTARFVNATTIVTCYEPDKSDANHGPLKENLRRLRKMRDIRNRQFTIAELPMPSPVYFNKKRLPASYANFYVANAGVLVPVFNDRNDATALKILEQAFPERRIVPIYCRDLVWGLGALHCITQQQPAG